MDTHEHFVKHNSQVVDVALGCNRLISDLFRRGIIKRPDDAFARRRRGGVEQFGDAEVGQIGVSVFVQQDVARFQVPMDDVLAMGEGQRRTDLPQQQGRFGQRPGAFLT